MAPPLPPIPSEDEDEEEDEPTASGDSSERKGSARLLPPPRVVDKCSSFVDCIASQEIRSVSGK